MESKMNLSVLESIAQVSDKAKKSCLSETFWKETSVELDKLACYFKVTQTEALFLALIFSLNYRGDTVDLDDLGKFLDTSPINLLQYNKFFEHLIQSGMVSKTRGGRRRVNVALADDQYSINYDVSVAILRGNPMPQIIQRTFESLVDVLEEIDRIERKVNDDEISIMEMEDKVMDLLTDTRHIKFIQQVTSLNLNIIDQHVFLMLTWKTMMGNDTCLVESLVSSIFERSSRRIAYVQETMRKKNVLFDLDLIEIEPATYLSDAEIKLARKPIEWLKEEGININLNRYREENILKTKDLAPKELFFNPDEEKQVGMLHSIIAKERFKDVQDQLKKKHLPLGITVLLFGSPGTGKTETAYQLARKTGRDIFYVDLSKTKSMWYGESEKKIKKIFIDYNDYIRESELTPILLFNEADGIISRRKENLNSGVSQTENTMQNILLEELEKFQGIFIATTNLINNIDPAFDRRFLFKIEFHKPQATAKTKIWKSKLPFLSEADSKVLAMKYDFSGGQIENILRKSELHEIINGARPNFNTILEFCDSELLVRNETKRIGFINNNTYGKKRVNSKV